MERIRLYFCGTNKKGDSEKDGNEGEIFLTYDEIEQIFNTIKKCGGIHIQTEDEEFDCWLKETK